MHDSFLQIYVSPQHVKSKKIMFARSSLKIIDYVRITIRFVDDNIKKPEENGIRIEIIIRMHPLTKFIESM